MTTFTIKELADQVGVSKQAIRDKIEKLNLQSDLSRDGNRFILNENQANLIISAFQGSTDKQTQNNFANQNTDLLYEIVKTLQNEIEEKNKQLAEKDKQLADLTATIKAQAQSINAREHSELAGTIETKMLEDTETKGKKGFLARLFGKE